MTKIKLILFDFDGTIADVVDPVVEILNRLSSEYGYPQITPETLEKYRNLRSEEGIKATGLSMPKFLRIMRRVQLELRQVIPDLKPIEGVDISLRDLKDRGYTLGILTTNSKENVEAFLQNNHLEIFSTIHTGSALFRKHTPIKRILKKYNLKPEELVYIADETKCIDAAKKAGVKSIGVSWGFHSEKNIKSRNPDYLLKDPKELSGIFQ